MTGDKQVNKDVKEHEPDVDSGFAWVVLAGSFVMYMFTLGTMNSYGVLYTEMVEHFPSGSGNTAWIGSFVWLFMLLLGPVANHLSERFSFRKVTIAGGILVGSGYFLSGFVQKMELMYLTFTVCGIGYGLSFLPCATIINFYFKKRCALANGIVVSSGGVGALVFPLLYTFLIGKYGIFQTFWILGAIVSNICVAGCVFRQPPSLVKTRRQEHISKDRNHDTCGNSSKYNTSDKKRGHKRERCCCCEFDFMFTLLKKPLFTMYVVAFTFATFGHVNSSLLIPAHIKALGYDKTYVALGVSITGGVGIIGRILFGLFADLKKNKRKYMFVVSMLIGGLVSLIAPFFKSFTYMAAYATIIAAFPGTFYGLVPILTIEVVGRENLPAAYGLISLGMAFASTICQPISGWMEDYYGNWHSAFILTGITFLLASITVLLEPAVSRCNKTPKHTDNDFALAIQEDKQNPEDQEIQTQQNNEESVIRSVSEEGKQCGKTNLAFMHENNTTVYTSVMKKDKNTSKIPKMYVKQQVILHSYKDRIGNVTTQSNMPT